jgi:hypothetical protein
VLPLRLGGRGRQRVEKTLLLGTAQGRKSVQGGKRRRGQMRAPGDPATAHAVEHHAAAETRRGNADHMGAGAVLHRSGDNVALELHLHAAGQAKRAATRQNPRVK